MKIKTLPSIKKMQIRTAEMNSIRFPESLRSVRLEEPRGKARDLLFALYGACSALIVVNFLLW